MTLPSLSGLLEPWLPWLPPGCLLGAFWEPSGSLLGVLGASWEPLGASWFPPLLRCVVDAPPQSHNVKKSLSFVEV